MKRFWRLHASGVSSDQKHEALCGSAAKHEAALLRRFAKPCGFMFFAFFGPKKAKKWQTCKDSNLNKVNQNHLCYRYTTGLRSSDIIYSAAGKSQVRSGKIAYFVARFAAKTARSAHKHAQPMRISPCGYCCRSRKNEPFSFSHLNFSGIRAKLGCIYVFVP